MCRIGPSERVTPAVLAVMDCYKPDVRELDSDLFVG